MKNYNKIVLKLSHKEKSNEVSKYNPSATKSGRKTKTKPIRRWMWRRHGNLKRNVYERNLDPLKRISFSAQLRGKEKQHNKTKLKHLRCKLGQYHQRRSQTVKVMTVSLALQLRASVRSRLLSLTPLRNITGFAFVSYFICAFVTAFTQYHKTQKAEHNLIQLSTCRLAKGGHGLRSFQTVLLGRVPP